MPPRSVQGGASHCIGSPRKGIAYPYRLDPLQFTHLVLVHAEGLSPLLFGGYYHIGPTSQGWLWQRCLHQRYAWISLPSQRPEEFFHPNTTCLC